MRLQTTAHNSLSSSPHDDSAGKTAVLYLDLCVALLSSHSSFYREGEELDSPINVMDCSRIPLNHTNDPRGLFSVCSVTRRSPWLTFALASRVYLAHRDSCPGRRHSYVQNAGGI